MMKKILICIFALFLGMASFAQPKINRAGPANTVVDQNLNAANSFIMPVFADTASANSAVSLDSCGKQIYTRDVAAVWVRSCVGASSRIWIMQLPAGIPIPGGQAWLVGGNSNVFADANDNATFGTNQTNGIYVKTDGVTRLYLDKYGIAPETINSVGLGYDPTDSNRITLFSGGGGGIVVSDSAWSLTGNTGTDYLTDFIGTTDYMPLQFKVNNTAWGILDAYTSSVGFGSNTLLVNEGANNITLGQNTLKANTTGLGNIAIGANALRKNITGITNVSIGYQALDSNTAGNSNVAIGYQALRVNTADLNTAVGTSTLTKNTSGTGNVAIGANSMQYLVTGISNVAVGVATLSSATNTGSFNTAVGHNALAASTTGTGNAALGTNALVANTTGQKNTAIGSGAAEANITGSFNTLLGQDAWYQATGGGYNTGAGYEVLNNSSTGSNNTALGYRGAGSITTGGYNTFIGNQSGSNASQKVDALRSGAFGTDSYTDCDTCISIGAPYNIKTILYGDTIRMPGLPTAPGVYAVRADANGNLSLADTTAVVSAPTWQQTLTAGSTLIGANTISGGGNDFTFGSIGTFIINNTQLNLTPTYSQMFSPNDGRGYYAYNDSINIVGVTSDVGTKALRYNPTTGLVSYADTTTGGGGDGIYGGSGTLPSSVDVDLDGNTFRIKDRTYSALYISPNPTADNSHTYLKATDTTGLNFSLFDMQSGSTFSQAFFEAGFNNETEYSAVTAYADVSGSTLQFDADTHTFNGTIKNPSIASQYNATDSMVVVNAADGTFGMREIPSGGSGANTALSNLASVAINTSLISDADNTDDLGSAANGWKDIYSRTLKLDGSSSGTATITAPAAAGTTTLTLPIVTGTLVQYVSNSITSSAAPSPTGDARVNDYYITALAAGATFAAPSGTPVNGNELFIYVVDSGGAQTLAFNAIYGGSTDIALPTTTTAGKGLAMKFKYVSTISTKKWILVGLTNGFDN